MSLTIEVLDHCEELLFLSRRLPLETAVDYMAALVTAIRTADVLGYALVVRYEQGGGNTRLNVLAVPLEITITDADAEMAADNDPAEDATDG